MRQNSKVKLKYLVKMASGESISNESINPIGDYPVYGGGILRGYSCLYTHQSSHILIGRQGANCGNVKYIDGKFWATEHAIVVTPIKDIILKWLFYVLERMNLNQYSISAAQPGLAVSTIRNLGIILPTKIEQRAITSYLDNKTSQIDTLISDKERLIELLKEKRQAVITETVTKGLDPNVKMKDSGIEWIGEVPEHWEIEKLKRLSNIELSNVDKKTVKGEEPVLLCNYVDVYYNNVITPDLEFMKATAKKEQINKFSLKEDDVIITKDSEDPNDIAVPAWVSQTMEDILCGYHLAHIRPKTILSGKYLLYCLLSTTFEEQFHSIAYGVTRYGILKGDIENSLFSLPPVYEQVEISNYLTKADKEFESTICEIKNQISKLKEYRESLIYEAVTGKIDVRDYATEKEASN